MAINFPIRCLLVAVMICTSADAAVPARDALFCKRTATKESIFAGRVRRDGRLDFVMTQWQPNGQAFLISGSAKRVGGEWVHHSEADWERCRITFRWKVARELIVDVDEAANCRADAGLRFGSKSVHFRPIHFKKRVTDELRLGLLERPDDPCKFPRYWPARDRG
jgi:hypothetical protein